MINGDKLYQTYNKLTDTLFQAIVSDMKMTHSHRLTQADNLPGRSMGLNRQVGAPRKNGILRWEYDGNMTI